MRQACRTVARDVVNVNYYFSTVRKGCGKNPSVSSRVQRQNSENNALMAESRGWVAGKI
jgi:hypothetical protein